MHNSFTVQYNANKLVIGMRLHLVHFPSSFTSFTLQILIESSVKCIHVLPRKAIIMMDLFLNGKFVIHVVPIASYNSFFY